LGQHLAGSEWQASKDEVKGKNGSKLNVGQLVLGCLMIAQGWYIVREVRKSDKASQADRERTKKLGEIMKAELTGIYGKWEFVPESFQKLHDQQKFEEYHLIKNAEASWALAERKFQEDFERDIDLRTDDGFEARGIKSNIERYPDLKGFHERIGKLVQGNPYRTSKEPKFERPSWAQGYFQMHDGVKGTNSAWSEVYYSGSKSPYYAGSKSPEKTRETRAVRGGYVVGMLEAAAGAAVAATALAEGTAATPEQTCLTKMGDVAKKVDEAREKAN
jgi:hypothetical protein